MDRDVYDRITNVNPIIVNDTSTTCEAAIRRSLSCCYNNQPSATSTHDGLSGILTSFGFEGANSLTDQPSFAELLNHSSELRIQLHLSPLKRHTLGQEVRKIPQFVRETDLQQV